MEDTPELSTPPGELLSSYITRGLVLASFTGEDEVEVLGITLLVGWEMTPVTPV